MNEQQDMVRDMRTFFNNTPNIVAAIKKLIEENASMKKDVEAFMAEKLERSVEKLVQNSEVKNGVRFITTRRHAPADVIKSVAFRLRNELKDEAMVFVSAAEWEGKPSLTVAFSDSVVAKGLNATQIVREAAKEIQGGGGGQPFFAQAGGKNVNGLDAAFEIVMKKIAL